jgi:elongation factor 3
VTCVVTVLDFCVQVVLPVLKDIEAKHSKAAMASVPSAISSTTLEYVAAMCSTLIEVKNFDINDWFECVVPYLLEFMDEAAARKITSEFLDQSYQVTQDRVKDAIEEEEGIDLCDCEFSLAYGAKILLNNTRLRLKKGRRYGLCGPNGAGKVCPTPLSCYVCLLIWQEWQHTHCKIVFDAALYHFCLVHDC